MYIEAIPINKQSETILVMRISDLACTDDHVKVRFEDPLITVMNALARGFNVLLVTDNDDKLRGVITISRVLNLLSKFSLGSKFIGSSISLFIDERPLFMHHEYPIEAALQLMAEEGKSYIVAVDGLKAVRLLTHRCILRKLLNVKLNFDLSKLSLKNVVTLLAHNSLAEAYKVMLEMGYYEVPIVEDEVIGVLRANDVINDLIGKSLNELRTIKVYGKCKIIRRPVQSLEEALELAFRESLNLVPILKSDGEWSFIKLEDLFLQAVRELGAFNIAEIIRGRLVGSILV